MSTGFVLFGPLYSKIELLVMAYVSTTAGKVIGAITPVITVSLTLSFIAYGLLVMRGAVDMPVNAFLAKCLRIGLILAVVLAGGLYQTEISNVIFHLPDDLASVLLPNQSNVSAGSLIDEGAGQGFSKAQEAFSKAGIFKSGGFSYALLGVIILLATAFLAIIGGAFIMMAKVALGILVALGPLFVACMLFESTKRFFESWTAQCVNYILIVVLFASIFTLLMSIYTGFISQLTFDKNANMSYTVGGAVIISGVAIIILREIPRIASGLAGGVALPSFGIPRLTSRRK